jgi:signal peptidase I
MVAALGALTVAGTVGVAVLVSLGEVTVVSTSGVSMQPEYHQGDLVVVRRSDYDVGDVVAYPGRTGETVLHRIIDRSGDRFVLQGDNNDWVDTERPTADEVIGEAWFDVPSGGKAIAWLKGPLPATAMLGALGMMITRSAPGEARRSRSRRVTALARRPVGHVPTTPPPYRGTPAPAGLEVPRPGGDRRSDRAAAGLHARTALGLATVVLLGAALIGALAFARPTGSVVDRRLPYEHRGELSYSAAVPESAVYEDGRLLTGDPIFLDLSQQVDVRFDYRLSPGALRDVRGTLDLSVELTASNGWSRSLPLGGPTELRGAAASVEGVLDMAELRRLLTEVEAETGVDARSYVLALVPGVEVTANAGGEQVTDRFSERVEMVLDNKLLRPDTADEPVDTDRGPVLRATRAAAVTTEAREDATFSALGRHVAVGTVRTVSLVAGALAAAVALVALGYLRVAGPRTAADRIRAKYGRRIVDVDGGEGGEARTIIDVSTMEALVRLADHHDLLILHHHSGSGDTFMVDARDTLYRYRVAPVPG